MSDGCHHGDILTLVDNNSSVYSPQHQSTIDTPLQPYTTVDNIIFTVMYIHDCLYTDTVHVHTIYVRTYVVY